MNTEYAQWEGKDKGLLSHQDTMILLEKAQQGKNRR